MVVLPHERQLSDAIVKSARESTDQLFSGGLVNRHSPAAAVDVLISSAFSAAASSAIRDVINRLGIGCRVVLDGEAHEVTGFDDREGWPGLMLRNLARDTIRYWPSAELLTGR